jgi:hypothetical protein
MGGYYQVPKMYYIVVRIIVQYFESCFRCQRLACSTASRYSRGSKMVVLAIPYLQASHYKLDRS